MGCGNAKLKEIQTTTAEHRKSLADLQATIDKATAVKEAHLKEERDAEQRKKDAADQAERDRKAIERNEAAEKAAAAKATEEMEASILQAKADTKTAIQEQIRLKAEADALEVETTQLEQEHEVKIRETMPKAEKNLKKSVRDAEGARQVRSRYQEAYDATQAIKPEQTKSSSPAKSRKEDDDD